MENASNALLMAGGILIAVLVLSLIVYTFAMSRQVEISYEKTAQDNRTQKFNSNFIQFEGRTDISAQEIVTIIKYCDNYEKEIEKAPTIKLINAGYNAETIKNSNDKQIEFIKKGGTFTCNKISYNTDSESPYVGRVSEITFTKN